MKSQPSWLLWAKWEQSIDLVLNVQAWFTKANQEAVPGASSDNSPALPALSKRIPILSRQAHNWQGAKPKVSFDGAFILLGQV